MKALLFSNSTNAGEDYLSYTLPYIDEFLRTKPQNAIFIPFAAVTLTCDEYFNTVNSRLSLLGVKLSSLHQAKNMKLALDQADLIITGGGNTFQLLHCLYRFDLLPLISKKIKQNIPYIGWSAGSNIACPTIGTTNDMPVVEPKSFNALNLIPFQINPHYTDARLPNHSGETREMRIMEYLQLNRDVYVVGLRESSLFSINDEYIQLKGQNSCRIFKFGYEPKEYLPEDNLSFLMQ
jgi:dipeptidase E